MLEYMKYDGNNVECNNGVTAVIKVQKEPRGIVYNKEGPEDMAYNYRV